MSIFRTSRWLTLGVLLLALTTTSQAFASTYDTLAPVFEVEPVLEGALPIPIVDNSVESQLSALEILEQAYQLYLTDRQEGFSAVEAEQRLISVLRAVGFESQSAQSILETLDQGTYAVPPVLKVALQTISKL